MILNKIKTIFLLGILTVLFISIGSLLGGPQGLKIALILSIIINFLVYFFSDKIVLKMYKAKPIDQNEHPKIYEIVNELTTKMNLPMPKLWIIQNSIANAFATGRNPKNSNIALTTGILEILDYNELRGVLAHELSHIKNNDILIATIAATIATSISYIIDMIYFSTAFGSEGKRKSNPIALIVLVILTPIIATIIQLAISRSREYLADETGAHYSKDPLALASALEKLDLHSRYVHMEKSYAHTSTAPLFIVNPFGQINWKAIFSTHPSVVSRIAKLQKISSKMFGKFI